MENLCDDKLTYIFGFLKVREILNVKLVCKRWNGLFLDEWRHRRIIDPSLGYLDNRKIFWEKEKNVYLVYHPDIIYHADEKMVLYKSKNSLFCMKNGKTTVLLDGTCSVCDVCHVFGEFILYLSSNQAHWWRNFNFCGKMKSKYVIKFCERSKILYYFDGKKFSMVKILTNEKWKKRIFWSERNFCNSTELLLGRFFMVVDKKKWKCVYIDVERKEKNCVGTGHGSAVTNYDHAVSGNICEFVGFAGKIYIREDVSEILVCEYKNNRLVIDGKFRLGQFDGLEKISQFHLMGSDVIMFDGNNEYKIIKSLNDTVPKRVEDDFVVFKDKNKIISFHRNGVENRKFDCGDYCSFVVQNGFLYLIENGRLKVIDLYSSYIVYELVVGVKKIFVCDGNICLWDCHDRKISLIRNF